MAVKAVPVKGPSKEITSARCGFCDADPFPIGIMMGGLPNGMQVFQVFCSNCRAVVTVLPLSNPMQHQDPPPSPLAVPPGFKV